jgi:hypothetical protein
MFVKQINLLGRHFGVVEQGQFAPIHFIPDVLSSTPTRPATAVQIVPDDLVRKNLPLKIGRSPLNNSPAITLRPIVQSS